MKLQVLFDKEGNIVAAARLDIDVTGQFPPSPFYDLAKGLGIGVGQVPLSMGSPHQASGFVQHSGGACAGSGI